MPISRDRSLIWRVKAVDGVEAFKASFTRFAYARHSHDSYAFGTIDDGAMHFSHRGVAHVVAAGGIIALNPGEVHDGHSAARIGCRYRMLYVERAAIDRLFAFDAPQMRRIFAVRGPSLSDARLAASIRRFHETLDGAQLASPLEQQSRLIQVLYLLFTRHGMPPLCVGEAKDETRYVRQAKDYIVAHLDEPVRLTDVAEAVGLSPFYFLRTFKRATGLPPHGYLNQLRLERARAQLRQGEPPAQIAAALGFADQSHLTRRFKAAFGVTPGQYASAVQ
jgi:AraC-like DNA-binding protein